MTALDASVELGLRTGEEGAEQRKEKGGGDRAFQKEWLNGKKAFSRPPQAQWPFHLPLTWVLRTCDITQSGPIRAPAQFVQAYEFYLKSG